ncbi:hypothetical protein M917_2183 [Psychrobacter aquaticus CMS 56]|uniref:Uncharacterized protein n=1 Tax=Psychrobacter aquaticus CMS 56 TaxID=1354303 RepID=U4T1W7_9GAMM|nr:hypothetical protein M917_2183 [Psychrobacter aquaticus CMS 56]
MVLLLSYDSESSIALLMTSNANGKYSSISNEVKCESAKH